MAKTRAKGFSPLISFSRTLSTPVYEQIIQSLRATIENGSLSPGTRLASTRVMAEDWGVSRNTVTQVFTTLLDEGYLVSRVGDGTYVAERRGTSSAGDAADADAGGNRFDFPFRHLSRRGRSLIGALDYGVPEQPRPFVPNLPDLREFPIRSWLRMMNEVSGGLTGNVLAGVSSAGYFPLRKAIAHHLSVTRGMSAVPEQVIVTTGSQQGLDLAIRLLADRGDPVWMENPGYPGTRAVLEANGANMQLIPVDATGMDIEAGRETSLSPRVICVSSMRQFPTGTVLSSARRKELLKFAESTGAWIVEDDFDAEVHYDALPPVSLAAQDRTERVIVLGTFSTTLVPSLRMGYLLVPHDLIRPFSNARSISQGHASLIEQMVLSEMMNRGLYAAHVRKMRTLYRSRQDALVSALKRELDYTVPDRERAAGMHVTVPLIETAKDERMVQVLAQNGVFARPLSPCYADKNGKQGVMLGFAAFSEKQITERAKGLRPLIPFIDQGRGAVSD